MSSDDHANPDSSVGAVGVSLRAFNLHNSSGPNGAAVAQNRVESVAEIFHKAQKLHRELSKLGATEGKQRDIAAQCYDTLLAVQTAVDNSGVFSRNEELEDVNTVDLKYALCLFLLGDVCFCLHDPAERISNVKRGMMYCEKYLQLCYQFKLLSKEEEERLKRGLVKPSDPASARAEKIAQYRRQQELEEQLKALLFRKEEQRRRAGRPLDDDTEEADEDDRSIILLTLRQAAGKAMDHLRFGNEEIQLLQHGQKLKEAQESGASAPNQPQPHSHAPAAVHIPAGGKPQNVLLGADRQSGQVPPTFRHLHPLARTVDAKVTQRTNARAEVFREFNPPTMDMDTWFRMQQEQGLLPSSSGPAVTNADAVDVEEPELTDAQQDAETMRAREWENWKDAHEKGAGNRLNR